MDRRREKGKENYSQGDNKDQLEEGVAAQPLPRRWRKKASGGNEGGIPKGKEKRRQGWQQEMGRSQGKGETGGAKIGKQAKVFRGSPFRGIERDGRRERGGGT